jgi:hypothetical protein
MRILLVAVAGLALAACSGTQKPKKSPEEQLVDTRQELRETLGELYRSYGGSEVAGSGGASGSPGSGGVLGHVVGEADRSYFERQCLAVGRGERPISVSPKLGEYLGRAEVAKGCRKAADLQRHVGELEKQVAAGR